MVTTPNPHIPTTCSNCGSSQMVPTVQGHPDGDLVGLAFQGKLSFWGSFAISDGMAIWACAECGERVGEERYLYDSQNRELLDAYQRTIDAVFNDIVPLAEAEVRKLRGLRFIKGFARRILDKSNDLFFVERDNGGYRVIIGHDRGQIEEPNSLLTEDRVAQMIEAIGETNRAEFAVRIGKEEATIFAEKLLAPMGLKVGRVSPMTVWHYQK